MDLGTPYFRATAAMGIPSSTSCLMAMSCSLVRRRGRPNSTPFRPGGVEAGPGAPADVLPLLAGHVGRHAGQDVAHEGLRRVGIGVQVLRPLDLAVGQGPQPDIAALQVVDRPHRLEVAPSQSVDGGNHQHVALGELLVQDVPLVPAVVVPRPRCRDVGLDHRVVHAGLDELAALDMGVAAGVARLLVPAGADVAVGGHISILPFFAMASQEGTVSIFASGENRAFSAWPKPASPDQQRLDLPACCR